VEFKCKESTFGEIVDVTEPQKCHYLVTFSSQLVCHPHALLVYPWLSEREKSEWDELFTNYKNEAVSKKASSLLTQFELIINPNHF
jgi:N-acetylglucosamine-1-phosphate transferase, gamma subunit